MAKQKNHILGLVDKVKDYADKRMLDFAQYSPYHMRVMDGGFVVMDVWTTGRYYIVMTDYNVMTDSNITERQGEKGDLPINSLTPFLDKIFFTEVLEIQ